MNLVNRVRWALHDDLPVVDVIVRVDGTSCGRLAVDVLQLLCRVSVACSKTKACGRIAYLEDALVLGHGGRCLVWYERSVKGSSVLRAG